MLTFAFMHYPYLVCILFGMPSLHLFTFLMFLKSCIIRYTAGKLTRVFTVVAYSDFTSRSPDYVLGKAGLFSTKLSLPELCYFTSNESTLHKVAIFFVASLVTTRWFLHMRVGVKDCAL